jgi:hypothetical protein
MNKAARRLRILEATNREPICRRMAYERSLALVVTFIKSKTPSPHWRFFNDVGDCVMHYWPATCRWWSVFTNESGHCDLTSIVELAHAENRDGRAR